MGWLFGHETRKDLIAHLTRRNTIKHCCVGNNLWCVHENLGIKWICLYMMQKHKGLWGYKDIDETAGPSAVTCPISYLEGLSEPQNVWSQEWRNRVHAYWAQRRRILPIGTRLGSKGEYKLLRNLRGAGYIVQLEDCPYDVRLTKSCVAKLPIFNEEKTNELET